jgi:hypothetical protein
VTGKKKCTHIKKAISTKKFLSEKFNQKLNRLKANADGGGGSFDLDEIKVKRSIKIRSIV